MTPEQQKEFTELAHPLMKWLCDNWHPHVEVTITPTSATLLEGVYSTGQVLGYVRD